MVTSPNLHVKEARTDMLTGENTWLYQSRVAPGQIDSHMIMQLGVHTRCIDAPFLAAYSVKT